MCKSQLWSDSRANSRRFLLRCDMHNALVENQFKVYYQPLVNLHNNKVIAVEALLRWEHPQFGMISPGEFIPLMEESGFIAEVGKWVLNEVCRTFKDWQNQGLPPIKISINYSPLQFSEEFLVENILGIIANHQLDPRFLIVEITESVLMDNIQKVIYDIQRLQESGIMVAVDDFGVGFSSLSYLSMLNVDILKIDRTFIQKIPSNQACTIITKSVINLARDLNIKLVAEGIETLEQLSYLQKFNCHVGQGFFFSKPVPQKEIEFILAKESAKLDRGNLKKI